MIRNPPCDTKNSDHTALLPVKLVSLLEHDSYISKRARLLCVRDKLQRVVLRGADRYDAHSCQSSLDIFKTKNDCNIMKDIKRTIFQAFSLAFSKLLL